MMTCECPHCHGPLDERDMNPRDMFYFCPGCLSIVFREDAIILNQRMEQLKVERRDLFDRYQALKMKVTSERRSSFLQFCEWAETHTDYIGGPASYKYHLSVPYGLLEHSLNVAENAIKIKNILMPEISDESCVICGLFHDFGKAGHPGRPKYIKNEPTPRQKQYGYGPSTPYKYTDDEGVRLTVPQAAVFYVTKHIDLTLEEYQAILIHDGQYVDDNQDYAGKEEPLSLILQYADNWSGFVVEKDIF